MPPVKIINLSEDRDFQTALEGFLAKANNINMKIREVWGIFVRKYKFSGVFDPEQPKDGVLKAELLCDEGDYDRARWHAELWLSRHPEKNLLCTTTVHCFSYKVIAFWKE